MLALQPGCAPGLHVARPLRNAGLPAVPTDAAILTYAGTRHFPYPPLPLRLLRQLSRGNVEYTGPYDAQGHATFTGGVDCLPQSNP